MAALALLAPLAFAAAGCSVFLGSSLTAEQVETEIKTQLAAQAQITADDVSCPGSLKGKVGESMVCTVTANGETVKVKVTVTAVEGHTIKFDIDEA